VPDDVGVLITGDGLGVPYHTSRKLLDADIQTVVVYGLGPVGLGNVLVQSYFGRTVIAVDLAPDRLAFARRYGAAHTVNVGDGDPVEQIRDIVGDRGVDAAIEAAGIPATAKQCFQLLRPGGTVIFNGEQGAVELSPSDDFIRRDIRAVGSWFFHVGEFPEMLQLWRDGLPVADLVTHVFPMEQAAEAFTAFAAGKTGKVLLTYPHPDRPFRRSPG
jgi:propanol-preferring alcohol dehydrogenase